MTSKYQKSKIYKLVSNSSDLVYYGSTYSKLSKRLSGHKADYKRHLNGGKNYITSFKLMELGDIKIILVENFPCDNIEELISKERFYIENNECVNKVIPGRTPKEYQEDNKDRIAKRKKEYQEANKEKISEHKKIKYQENREERIKQVKEYSEANKEKIKKYRTEYRIKNKEEISKKRKVIINCECGSETSRNHLARHKRTKKHIDFLESI